MQNLPKGKSVTQASHRYSTLILRLWKGERRAASLRFNFCGIAFLCLSLMSCSTLRCSNCQPMALNAEGFPPLLATYRQSSDSGVRFLWVYLEGDGRPWVPGMMRSEPDEQWKLGKVPAKNPSSQQQIAYRLMLAGTGEALYLNRPCYGYNKKHGYKEMYGYKKMPETCKAKMWTSDRYSRQTVQALSSALEQVQEQLGARPLIIVGHSGGGALAMLLAEQRADIAAVVTLSGNLDHKAWTEHHNYLPLEGSLNAVNTKLLPRHIPRWHFAGKKDRVIPASMVRQATAGDPYARLSSYPVDHTCCWQQHWVDIQSDLIAHLNATID